MRDKPLNTTPEAMEDNNLVYLYLHKMDNIYSTHPKDGPNLAEYGNEEQWWTVLIIYISLVINLRTQSVA